MRDMNDFGFTEMWVLADKRDPHFCNVWSTFYSSESQARAALVGMDPLTTDVLVPVRMLATLPDYHRVKPEKRGVIYEGKWTSVVLEYPARVSEDPPVLCFNFGGEHTISYQYRLLAPTRAVSTVWVRLDELLVTTGYVGGTSEIALYLGLKPEWLLTWLQKRLVGYNCVLAIVQTVDSEGNVEKEDVTPCATRSEAETHLRSVGL